MPVFSTFTKKLATWNLFGAVVTVFSKLFSKSAWKSDKLKKAPKNAYKTVLFVNFV